MLEHVQGLSCPKCNGPVVLIGGAFIEAGEYDGDSYEAEGNTDVFQCCECDGAFADLSALIGEEARQKPPRNRQTVRPLAPTHQTETSSLDNVVHHDFGREL